MRIKGCILIGAKCSFMKVPEETHRGTECICCHPRRQSQRYIYWTMESPVNAFHDQTSLMATERFYNWSHTYRLDSTFPSPYGMLQKVR